MARLATTLTLLVLTLTSGCITVDPPAEPRPPLALPQAIADRYQLPGPVTEEFLVPLHESQRTYRGRLRCGTERPKFHLLLPERSPAPFVLCLPILAGGRELMWLVAAHLRESGFAVAFGERVESAMKPHQDPAALEVLLRRSVIHNRAILAWARTQPFAQPDMGILGISTGGVIGGLVLATEPDLKGGVLMLAGGDLPDLFRNSSENRIEKWWAARRSTDGHSDDELVHELREHIVSDPALLAPYVATEKVLLVTASLDTVVPGRNQDVLWEALGRPERLKMLILSHYSTILDVVLPTQVILTDASRFLRERLTPVGPAR